MSLRTRWRRLEPAERRLTLRAWGAIVWASLRLRSGLDVRDLEDVGADHPHRRAAAGAARDPAMVDAAVRRASRYVPGARCLAQALAARSLLRASGTPTIRYAVGRDPVGGKLEAHAWVEMDGRRVAGDPPAEGWVTLRAGEH